MTDEEKHQFCRERGIPHAVFLPVWLYRLAERDGYDMRYYVLQKAMPAQ